MDQSHKCNICKLAVYCSEECRNNDKWLHGEYKIKKATVCEYLRENRKLLKRLRKNDLTEDEMEKAVTTFEVEQKKNFKQVGDRETEFKNYFNKNL